MQQLYQKIYIGDGYVGGNGTIGGTFL